MWGNQPESIDYSDFICIEGFCTFFELLNKFTDIFMSCFKNRKKANLLLVKTVFLRTGNCFFYCCYGKTFVHLSPYLSDTKRFVQLSVEHITIKNSK